MKFDEWTLKVLKNFSTIEEGLWFRKGSVQATIAESKKMFASARLKQEFPQEFGVADLSRFIAALGLFKEPEIEFGERYLTVNDGSRRLDYGYADKKTIRMPPSSEVKLPSTDLAVPVSWSILSETLKAAGSLGQPEIAVVGADGKLMISTLNAKKPSNDEFSTVVGDTDRDFSIVLRVEDVKFIPLDYTVKLDFSKKLALFSGLDVEYFVGAETTSKVNS